MTTMQFAILDPMIAAAARTARTPADTTRLVKELNENARRHREDAAAKDRQRAKDLDEQIALTRRLSEGGRTRRAGSVAATTPTANVFDLYRAREEARQRQLAVLAGARR